MKKNLLFAFSLLLMAGDVLIAQSQRYLDEIFTTATVTSNVVYGNNISLLTGTPTAEDLKLDIYEPSGDAETQRPLVLIFHTGSFLPAVINGQPTGSRTDSAVVEMCTRFAKRGYVAAAVSYRLGWNPLASTQEGRTGTLINAAYRGVQDAHTAVRFFRKEKTTYKIDDTKIALGGIGTGGYITLGFAYFDKNSELEIDKFIDFTQNPPAPYINVAASGDFQGTVAAQLNTPSNLGYSSAANLVFNCGGALGDSTWIEAGNIPVIAFHCTKDPNAPYETGNVIVPTTGQIVVEASGSYDVLRIANDLGLNDTIKQGIYSDAITARANSLNDGYEGLYPFVTPDAPPAITCNGPIVLPGQEQGAPWDWWNETAYKNTIIAYNGLGFTDQDPDTMACNAKRGNPDMSAAKGRAYIDTIQGYLAQRMVNVMGLPGSNVGITEKNNHRGITIYPNPSNDVITISSDGKLLNSIEVISVTGQTIRRESGINSSVFVLSKKHLSEGIYFIKVKSETSESIHKIVIY